MRQIVVIQGLNTGRNFSYPPKAADPQQVVGWVETMLRIVRPTDRHGSPGGPHRDVSRLDPPYSSLP
ncbi:MAG: hypothetical protein ACHRXM_36355, partial [Isosphaerales bacterium]